MNKLSTGLSELSMRLALHAADIGIWSWTTGNDMVASEECWKLWGVPLEEAAEPGAWAANFHPDDRTRFLLGLNKASQGHGWLDEEYRVVSSDGTTHRLASRGRAAGTTRGAERVVGVTQDVSGHSEEDRTRAALAAIVASCDDAIVGKTLEGTITSWNNAAESMFGYRANEIIGRHISLLIPQDRQNEEVEIITAVRSGRGVSHYESKRLRNDGRLIDVSLTVSPIYDRFGQIIGASKIARDITALKRVQEAEQDANHRREAFLAILAHELRNPLAPIRSAVRILEMKGSDPTLFRSTCDVIDRQVDHLVRLVDDLLDVSRLTLGRIQLKPATIDLRDVIQEALAASRSLLSERGHQVTLTTPVEELPVNGDWVRLVQVVSNLLNNAARYTPRGGQVTIAARSEGSDATLTVADTGIGISPEVLPHVFDLFVQAPHSSERTQSGLGVGLALARDLLRLHSGTITAESDGVGKGSRFIVRLPLVAGARERRAPAEAPSLTATTKRYRFLVVDDNVDAAESQGVLLNLLGHDAWTAHDGHTAIEQARRHLPDVVLLDLGMPGMSGFEIAAELRTIPGLAAATLVAQTGWGQAEFREKAARAGFDVHLTKPIDISALLQMLEAEREGPDGGQPGA